MRRHTPSAAAPRRARKIPLRTGHPDLSRLAFTPAPRPSAGSTPRRPSTPSWDDPRWDLEIWQLGPEPDPAEGREGAA